MKGLAGLKRPEYILKEEVKLVGDNFTIGVLYGYNICALICTALIFWVDRNPQIFAWFSLCVFTCSVITYIQYSLTKKSASPTLIAKSQIISLLLIGLLWGYLPFTYIDHPNHLMVFVIIVVTVGIMCGGAFMQAPYLPAYLAYLFSIAIPITFVFFFAENNTYIALGFCAIIYSAVLVVCAIHLESVINESITLRYENNDLIEMLQNAIFETEKANSAKSVFLASASHDLRQPIHALSLFLSSLKNTDLNADQQSLVNNIELASSSTQDMLDSLLDYSKLDAGVVEAYPTHFKLQDLLTNLEAEYLSVSEEKGLEFRSRDSKVTIYADRKLLELVIRNLISNAIRYTKEGGVLLASRARGDSIVIEVWDTGIGIDDSAQQAIFEDFYQIDNPERDSEKGFGLGLAIVQKLVATMGLELSFSSTLGQGSVFRVSVPRSLNPAMLSSERKHAENLPLDIFDKPILVIDDNQAILDAMQSLLLPYGCLCLLARSEKEALEKVQTLDRPLELIITDYRLQDHRTGGEAIDRIRKQLNSKIPAIIVTGDTSPERIQKASGQDALLLHKPLSSGDLLDAISKMLED